MLAVYRTLEGFDTFRSDLDRQAFAPLIDLVAMTAEELLGSGLIDTSGAVPLAEVGLLGDSADRVCTRRRLDSAE